MGNNNSYLWCYKRWDGKYILFQVSKEGGHYSIQEESVTITENPPDSNYTLFSFTNLSKNNHDYIQVKKSENIIDIPKDQFYLLLEDANQSNTQTAFQIKTVADYILAVDYYRYVSYLQYILMICDNIEKDKQKTIENAVSAELKKVYNCSVTDLKSEITQSSIRITGVIEKFKSDDFYPELERARSMYNNGGGFCYYRGVGHTYFPATPGIFRQDHLREEARWYRMMKTNFYDQLDELHYLDRLAMMQHYELPTRLLDVTSNPLVALYMAVNKLYTPDDKEQSDYGEVIVFFDELTDTKSYDSNSVLVIAALAKLSYEEKSTLSKFIEEAERLIPQKVSDKVTAKNLKDVINFCVHMSAEENNNEYFFAEHEKERISHAIHETFANPSDIVRYLGISGEELFFDFVKAYIHLLRTIRRENPAFSNKIDIFMLTQAYHVRVGMTNDRMRVQYGSFIIVGLDKDYIDNHMKSSRKDNIRRTFITDKSTIYKQLNALAINDMTMFPDMSHQAKYLRDQR